MPALSASAAELSDWFHSIQNLASDSMFGIVPKGPHRQAIILDTLRRNARTLAQSPVDNTGNLYSPLCFFLAGACLNLGVTLGTPHWQSALDNVVELEQRTASHRARSASVGLESTSPAEFFKQEFDEAVRQAALLTNGPTYLDREDRQIGLGLAVNWTLRLLLAYALECAPPEPSSDVKDLAWLASIVRSKTASSEANIDHGASEQSADREWA